jgi:outer membrane receptor for ferrienterochelin and colicins
MHLNKYILLILILSGCISQGYSQEVSLSVRDARSKEAVSFAHLLFESFDKSQNQAVVTDMDGKVKFTIQKSGLLTVTALGYRNQSDSINPGVNKTILLQPSVYNMDEVVVTGQYTPQPVDKSIFRVKVIGSRLIEQKASNNLSELMSGELNIRSSFDGALGSKITLQGLGGEHIKFLIDGVPLIGRMNGNIDLGQLNLFNVKQIEVIEGPMSVIYGSNALAGVINIITKENNQTAFTTNAGSYLESVGVYNFNADAAVSKNRWSGSIAGARNFFDGFSAYDTTRSKRWKPKRQYNADGTLSYVKDDFKARLSLSYFNEMLQDKGNLLKPYYETAFDSEFKSNRLTSKLDVSKRLFKDRYLTVLGSYSYYDRVKNTYFNDLTTLEKNLTANIYDQDTSSFNQYLLRAEFSKSTPSSPFNYQLGIDLNYENGFGRRILDKQQSIGDYAAFLSVKLQPAVRLMLQPGLRYGFNTKYKSPLVYSLNLKWDLLEDLSLRASYAKGFRAPSLKELYLEFVDVNHNIRGNENLKAENSHNLNLAMKYHHEKETYDYGMEMNLFYNNISNSISLATVSVNDALYTYVNLDKMITQGYQLQFNNRLYPWLEIKLGVGQTGRKQIQNKEVDIEMIYSTDVLTTINYQWRLTDLNFGLYYKYNGDYPEVFVNQNGQIFRTIMEGYHTFDITLGKPLWNNRLQAQIGAKNIFDNTNIAVKGDTGGGGIHSGGGSFSPVGWGRTYFVRLAMQIRKFK